MCVAPESHGLASGHVQTSIFALKAEVETLGWAREFAPEYFPATRGAAPGFATIAGFAFKLPQKPLPAPVGAAGKVPRAIATRPLPGARTTAERRRLARGAI